MNSRKYFKSILVFLGFICLFSKVNGQQVYAPFIFSQIPQDYQLYARNDKNLATIPVEGTIQTKGWKSISISVYRENKLFGYQKVNVQVKNSEDSFSANATIKAEKAEYSIFIYGIRGEKDSILITKRTNLVAGDFYVIYGDSNGNTQSVVDYYSSNKYIRTFGRYNHEIQNNYSPKDTIWTQNEDYFLPKVGAWGTMLQELITSKYEIPVAIITGGGPGMNIDFLTDRSGTGVNPGGVYNTLGYRIKKSGLINNIKGFFIWHGVYELFNNTNAIEYDAKVKKLMGYFKQDFPNVGQYVYFQSALVRNGSNGDLGASLRESQRNLAAIYPSVIPYAAQGLPGYDGVHYTTAGYATCANEMLAMIEPLFYNKPQDVNLLSPNVIKAFYVDETHQRIKMVFQENQQIVAGKDTTVKINGQNADLSLKKWFFQDGNFSKNIDIQEITTANNAMILYNASGYKAKKLSYLPSFHKDNAVDFPVFVGPYIKNIFGKRALSFNVLKIQEPIIKPINLSATSNVSQVKLTWNNPQFPLNAQLIIERKLEKENSYKIIKMFKSNISEFIDIGLPSATAFNYQIKLVTDSSESVYAQVSSKTLVALGKPKVTASIIYNNKIQVSFSTVSGAETYTLTRRLKNATSSAILLNINYNTDVKSVIDSNLVPNQTYLYKIITTRSPNEVTLDSIEVTTPALLPKPELIATILYYNSLKISWKPVLGAITYQIERKLANENYKKLPTFDSKVTELLDNDLKENSIYTYRLKAFGEYTESIESEIIVQTSALLSKPELTATILNYNSLKIAWKPVLGAITYQIERKLVNENYKKLATFDSKVTELLDNDLKENTIYTYRLKAFGDKTESIENEILVQTPTILQTPEISQDFITHESIKLKWKAIASANKYSLERQSVGETSYQKIFESVNLLDFTDTKLKENSIYNYRLKAFSSNSESIFATINLKTLAILAVISEEERFVKVFPNPANAKLTISFIEPISGNLSLINLTGEMVFEQNFTKQKSVEINVSFFKKGIYLVIVKTNQELYTQKVVIE